MKPFHRTEGLLLAESKLIPETRVLAPASAVLQGLLNDAPADKFTLAWLLGHLHKRSFGFIILLLALAAMLPGISYVAGLLLAVPALEMIAGRARGRSIRAGTRRWKLPNVWSAS
jgi:Exopolysaccharide synthesis, ExoD